MTDYGRIRSTVKPEPLELDEYSAYVNTDVTEMAVDIDGEKHIEYEYNQIRYDKNEYIKLLSKQNTEFEEQLTDTQLALCEIYEGMM